MCVLSLVPEEHRQVRATRASWCVQPKLLPGKSLQVEFLIQTDNNLDTILLEEGGLSQFAPGCMQGHQQPSVSVGEHTGCRCIPEETPGTQGPELGMGVPVTLRFFFFNRSVPLGIHLGSTFSSSTSQLL